jgi:hypothetical protein
MASKPAEWWRTKHCSQCGSDFNWEGRRMVGLRYVCVPCCKGAGKAPQWETVAGHDWTPAYDAMEKEQTAKWLARGKRRKGDA